MKWIIFFLALIALILGLLWWAIGGQALAISFGALVLILVIFAAFGVGSWWTASVMERGARIALVAQTSDDKRDGEMLRLVGSIAKEGVRIGRDQAKAEVPQYPQLPAPNGNSPIDGEFRIEGFE